MRLHVEVLPLQQGPANSLYSNVQLTAQPPKKFGINVRPEQRISEVWSLLEARYKRDYLTLAQQATFIIKKLQDAYGGDIDVGDTVADVFEGVTDQEKRVIHVIQGSIDREMSVLATSNLRPVTAQKRLLDVYQSEGFKRRRIEQDPSDYAVENLHPDRPLLSRERDDGEDVFAQLRRSAGEERAQSRGADPQVIVIKDSQLDAVPSSDPYVDEPKSESPEHGLPTLQDIPPAAVQSCLSPVLGDFNTTPKDAFIKPSLPASKARANSRQMNGVAKRPTVAAQTSPNPYSSAVKVSEPTVNHEEIASSTPPSAQPNRAHDHLVSPTANTPQRARVATGKLRSPSTSAKKQLELIRARRGSRGENTDLKKDPNDPTVEPVSKPSPASEQPQALQADAALLSSSQRDKRKSSPSVVITPTPQQRSRSRSAAASERPTARQSNPPMSEESKLKLEQRKAKEAERLAEQQVSERKREASVQRKARETENQKKEAAMKDYFAKKEANDAERRSRERSGAPRAPPTVVATVPNSSAQASLRRSVSFSNEVEYSDPKKPPQRRSNGDLDSPASILKKAPSATPASSSPSIPPEVPRATAGRRTSSISAPDVPKAKPTPQAKVKRFSLLCESRELTEKQRPPAKQIFPPGYGPADLARLSGTPTAEAKPKPEPGSATATKASQLRQAVLPYSRDRSSSRPLEADLPTKATPPSQAASSSQAARSPQAIPSSQDESIVISSDSEEEESDVSSSSEEESEEEEETPKKAVQSEGGGEPPAESGASRSPSPGSSPPELSTTQDSAPDSMPNGIDVTSAETAKASRSPMASARHSPSPSKQLTSNPSTQNGASQSTPKGSNPMGLALPVVNLSATSSQQPTPSQILTRDDDYNFPSIKARQEDIRRRRQLEQTQEEKRLTQERNAEAQRLAAQNAGAESSSDEGESESSSESSSDDDDEVAEVTARKVETAISSKATTPSGDGRVGAGLGSRMLYLFKAGGV
ncbi:hypothetical protein H2199_003367 [Coniosporium tulheliwenetii]|uniref:Uncharacterized protein n=1 Tax=Coniosporium tulheliwenetii TaxID=3383036 RepID=A0ACC2ZCM9_9PEZI|nr:hypothetical protein H2199_003367 [Cladosporium sp. JES 115]